MTAALPWTRDTLPMVGARVARAWLWVLMLAALLSVVPSPALAADEPVSRFVWDEVSVAVRLQDDGTARVREHLTVRFTGGPFRQGFREIPLAYMEEISQVTVAEVGSGPPQAYAYVSPRVYSRTAPRTYTFQRVGTDMRIEWSFPPTMTATRSFVIEYIARGVVQVHADVEPPYQELAWTGVDRALTADAPVTRATLIFILPRPVDPGATVARGNGTAFGGTDGQTWYWRAENLGAGESLEASLQFPPLVAASKPSWQDARARQIVRDARVSLAFLGLALLTAVGGSVGLLAAWWTRGRDPVAGPTPEYLTEPPDDTPPGVVGALLDEQIGQREYVATLIDLARRGVVGFSARVQPVKSSNGRVVVTLLEPYAPLAPFERTLLDAFFGDTWWPREQVSLPLEGQAGIGEALERVELQLSEELVHRGYFRTRPARTRAGWRFTSAGLWVTAIIIFVIGLNTPAAGTWAMLTSVVLVALGAVLFVVARHMPQKTQAGAEAAARWRAFGRYMEAIDRVGVRDRGQEGFERFLPYAVALGIERPWITAFASVGSAAPRWYGLGDLGNLDGPWRVPGELPRVPLPASGPDLGGLQGLSSLSANSLQASSGALFDLFNAAGASFNPANVARQVDMSNAEIAFKILFTVLRVAAGGRGSGGGRGGFS